MAGSAVRAPSALLIHGLWMRGWVMRPLAARLRTLGWASSCFAHPSLRAEPGDTLLRLSRRIEQDGGQPVHLVGHSLGGLLALALCHQHPQLPVGRIVCLGSPLAGSLSARRLRELRLPWLVGRSCSLLEQGVALPQGREVGVIAGTRGVGAGRWLARIEPPHDGTVSVAETRIEGLGDHLCLPHSHSGLLLASDVAAAVAAFLRSGRFA